MRAGRLKHLITIQYPKEIEDSVGESIISWIDFYQKIPSSREPFRSNEFERYGKDQTSTKFIFGIRYLPGITSDMRILSDGLYYEIDGIPLNPDSRDIELIITALEKSYDQG